jgi:hypothetical protein
MGRGHLKPLLIDRHIALAIVRLSFDGDGPLSLFCFMNWECHQRRGNLVHQVFSAIRGKMERLPCSMVGAGRLSRVVICLDRGAACQDDAQIIINAGVQTALIIA